MHILVGIPITMDTPRVFTISLLQSFTEWIKKYSVDVRFDPIIPIDRARNNLAQMALDLDADYLFFLDSDVVIEKNTLDMLLSHNADVVSGLVFEKSFPYAAIVKRQIAPNLYENVEVELNRVYPDVDGVGMGCCLIRTDVFRKIPFPWFQFVYFEKYGKRYQLSEDLYFCQQLHKHGYKVVLDTRVTCGHWGTLVTMDDYSMHQRWRKLGSEIRNSLVDEVCEFLKEPREEVVYKFHAGTLLTAKDFELYGREMYSKSVNYIYDLANWHISERFLFDITLVKRLVMTDAKTILDFGCGIGQNAIMLAATKQFKVSMTDVDGPVSQFARWRAKKRGYKIEWIPLEKLRSCKRVWDLVLCLDVLEHIPDDQFAETIELLDRIAKKLLITTNFGKTKTHPMHLELTDEKAKLLQKLQPKVICL